MKTGIRTLFLVSDKNEAQQSLAKGDKKNDAFLALSLEAEFYLKSKFEFWENPLYQFLEITGPTCNYNFLLPNFKVAYDWARITSLEEIRDRLGYFLSEFERSYKFASCVIHGLNPNRIVMGNLKDYPGSSVINGSLKTHAFYVISQEKGLDCEFFLQQAEKKSLRKFLGAISNKIIFLKKSVPKGFFELVILAPPRHVLQLRKILGDLMRMDASILVVTYTVTPTYKKKLDNYVKTYYLKEDLVDQDIGRESKGIIKKYLASKPWIKFSHPKYEKNKAATSFLRNKIKDVVETELLESMKDRLVAEKFFDIISCKTLLTTTDPDSKVMPFINIAKNKGVKTLALQHGVMWSPAPPSVIPISDKFISWSSISRLWVRKIKGFEKVHILIGQSPFHYIFKTKSGATKNQKIIRILFLATIVILDVNMIAYYQKKLFATLSNLDGVKVTIRIHPFQDKTNLSAIIGVSKYPVSFDENENLQDSVNDSDIVISEETTAGFDAMISGKPTIFFNPYSGEDYFEAKRKDFAMTILSEKDIEEKLLWYLREKQKWNYYANRGRRFAQQYLGLYNSGPNKLAKVIKSLTAQNG